MSDNTETGTAQLPEKIEELFHANGFISMHNTPNLILTKKEFVENLLGKLKCGCAPETPKWLSAFLIQWLDAMAVNPDSTKEQGAVYRAHEQGEGWSPDQIFIFHLIAEQMSQRGILEHGNVEFLAYVCADGFIERWQSLSDKEYWELGI